MPDTHTEIFRTDCVARPRRLSFWNEVAASTFGDIAVDARAPDFDAQLKRVRIGTLTLASVESSPARVSGVRSRGAAGDGWFLLLNERGVSRMNQGAREVCLQAGELTALRADESYRIEFGRPNKTLVLHVPRDPRHIDLDPHVARRHGPDDVPLFVALMRQLEKAEPSAELQPFERLALDAARLCWPAPARTARRQSILAWEHRVYQYVEQNLSDPELGAGSIAQRFGVSARFVHMVFARSGRTAGSFILERRLSLAAAHLRSAPAERITNVAFAAGFADLSHFCRTFRRRFGVSARDYRRTG